MSTDGSTSRRASALETTIRPVVVAAIGLIAAVFGSVFFAHAAQDGSTATRFEVVSIRHVADPSDSRRTAVPIGIKNGQLVGRSPLQGVIHLAYGAEVYERTIAAEPSASRILDESFDFRGLPRASSPPPTNEEVKAMMRQMLADRFGLRVRVDSEPASVTVLTLIKPGVLGRGVRPAPEGCTMPPAGVNLGSPKFAEVALRSCVFTFFDGRIRGTGTLDELARVTSFMAQRPILNETGLTGMFAVDVTASISSIMPARPSRFGPSITAEAENSPAFTDALRTQMGIAARTERRPIRLFVVEQVGPLVEN